MGLEIGADIYSCNLDDYMVFNNNDVQTLFFFKELLYRHINSLLPDGVKYSDENHELIDFLYDARVLHIIKQSVSSRDTPGIRYNVYSIDYGCYVDLINTSRNPKGLFEVEDENGENDFCKVPQNDYRSIRRAILNMAEFDSHIQKINTR